MPVHRGRFGQPVDHVNLELVARTTANDPPRHLPVVGPGLHHPPPEVHLDRLGYQRRPHGAT
ncbi:hypothetical protein [Amycolatopsis marina]|uniref:hypothetical protein n=1 Tax=Amycolatopsis marina TaxID=490629 RepID=UPI001FE8F573|nr:hypothetical protein [Amycolatopsis marina]